MAENGNGSKGLWIVIGFLVMFMAGGYYFTLWSVSAAKADLKDAVADRNQRIRDLQVAQDARWTVVGKQLDTANESLQDIRERIRVMECAQGLPSCRAERRNQQVDP